MPYEQLLTAPSEPKELKKLYIMEEKGNLWEGIISLVAVILICGWMLKDCIGCDSDNEQLDETTIEQEQEQEQEAPKKEEKKDPIANFVGTYYLYDNEGHTGNKVFVVDDGRLFYESIGSEHSNELCGYIRPVSDKVFTILLSHEFFGFGNINQEVWSYVNGNTSTRTLKLNFGKTLVFDFTDNRMYIDKSDYDNRDYTSPEYYKFRFTKK